MRRLSPPSGQEMREEARSGPRAVEVGRNWTSEESRGLSDGSDTEVQEKGDSGHLQVPYPGALWEMGKDRPFRVDAAL